MSGGTIQIELLRAPVEPFPGGERARVFNQFSTPGHELAFHSLRDGGVESVSRAKKAASPELDGSSKHRPIQWVRGDQGRSQYLIRKAATVLGAAPPTGQGACDLQFRKLGQGDRELPDRDLGQKGPAGFRHGIVRVRSRHPDAGVDDKRCHLRSRRFRSASNSSLAERPAGARLITSSAASSHERSHAVGVSRGSSLPPSRNQRR